MQYKLQNTRHLLLFKHLTFSIHSLDVIIYLKTFSLTLSKPQCFPNADCESNSVHPTTGTKLGYMPTRTKTELVYIGRQRTTSLNKNNTRVNKNCKYNAKEKTQIPMWCHFLAQPVQYLKND